MIREQQEIARTLAHVFNVFIESECEIRPHFMLAGPSGSGKSWLVQQAAQECGAAFFEINAAQLTKEGFSGNSLSKAMRPLINTWDRPTICFVDEFDKLLDQNGGSMEHTLGVQDEFLKVLESDFASIFTDYGKYQQYEAKRLMFVFAGAFGGQENMTLDDLRERGLRTEFVGRVGLVFNTQKISLESMLEVVPQSSLLASYLKTFPNHKKSVVVAAVRKRLTEVYKDTNVGLRIINTLIHQYFLQKA